MSTEQGTKPEGADPTKATAEQHANPDQGSGAPANGQSAPAGTQSTGLSEQEITEYRAWKESLGKANVTDPRALVEDYTRKSQRAAELEDALSRERQASDILRGRAQEQTDPEAAAYEAYRQNPYDPEAQRAWLDARDSKRRPALVQEAMHQFQLNQRVPVAAEMLGIRDQRQLGHELASVHSSLTPDELALVALSRKGQLDGYVDKSRKQREATARRAADLDQFGEVRGSPRIPGSGADGGAIAIPFQEWAAATKEAKARIRNAKEKYVIVDPPKHFDINAD